MPFALRPELNVVASPALLERGCVCVIKLDAIKTEIGPRWEKLRASVSAHLEGLLRQKLSASDFFTQLDEVSFLVSMPAAGAEASQIFCLRIAHELHNSLLGNCDVNQLRLAKAVRIVGDEVEAVDIVGTNLVRLAINAGLDCLPEGTLPPAECTANLQTAARLPEYVHRYVPLWDAQREAITTYRCVTEPVIATNSQANAQFKVELGAVLSRIGHAAQALSEQLKLGERFLVSVSVSYDTLTSPVGRMEIASTYRGLSASLRPYLIFEIVDLPHGVPQSRLSELVGILRPFCRAVTGVLPVRSASFGACRTAGLAAIGVSLSANGVVADAESEILKLCTAAKRLHILSFVLDVAAADAVRACHAHGVNLVSGPVIGAPVTAPKSVTRLSTALVLDRSRIPERRPERRLAER